MSWRTSIIINKAISSLDQEVVCEATYRSGNIVSCIDDGHDPDAKLEQEPRAIECILTGNTRCLIELMND